MPHVTNMNKRQLYNYGAVTALLLFTRAFAISAPHFVGAVPLVANTILLPIPTSKFIDDTLSSTSTLFTSHNTISSKTPTANVTLFYGSVTTTSAEPIMFAEIKATMMYPSVLLEEVPSIKEVRCSASSIVIVFDSLKGLQETADSWGTSTFILFTYHGSDCNVENERGIYIVRAFATSPDALTVTTFSTKTTFEQATREMSIEWTKPLSTNSMHSSFFGNFPGDLDLKGPKPKPSPLTREFSLVAENPSLSGIFTMSGHAHYSWLEFRFTDFFVDMDLSLLAGVNVALAAGAAFSNEVYSYSPASSVVSAFTIPGILDIGPSLSLTLGVETFVSGEAAIAANMSASSKCHTPAKAEALIIQALTRLNAAVADGNVHLDLVDSGRTTTSGWKPVYTHQTNISAAVQAQLNPYAEVAVEVAINFLKGKLELSSGIRAKPQLLSVFDVTAEFDIGNSADVTMPASKDAACTNGMWHSSAFAFLVTAFVTHLYALEMFRYHAPIYESGCWSWAPEVIEGSS